MIVSPYPILQQRHHGIGVLCGSSRSTVALDLNFALRHGLFQPRGGVNPADVAEQHGSGFDDAGRVGVIAMPRSIIRGAEPWIASNMA